MRAKEFTKIKKETIDPIEPVGGAKPSATPMTSPGEIESHLAGASAAGDENAAKPGLTHSAVQRTGQIAGFLDQAIAQGAAARGSYGDVGYAKGTPQQMAAGAAGQANAWKAAGQAAGMGKYGKDAIEKTNNISTDTANYIKSLTGGKPIKPTDNARLNTYLKQMGLLDEK
jgi:hypothetical protein